MAHAGHCLPGREFGEVKIVAVHDQAIGHRTPFFFRKRLQGVGHVAQPDRERRTAPGFPGAKRLGLVVAEPGNAHQLRRIPREPRVDRIIGGPGLAGQIGALDDLPGPCRCSVGGNAPQQVVHDVSRARIDRARRGIPGNDRLGLHDDLA